MIGKAGILTKVPFIGPPVAASLRQLEGVMDVSNPRDFGLSGYPRARALCIVANVSNQPLDHCDLPHRYRPNQGRRPHGYCQFSGR